MSLGGQICPYCRNYNPLDEPRCLRCGRYVGPKAWGSLLRATRGLGLGATQALVVLCCLNFAFEMLATMRLGAKAPALGGLLGVPARVLFDFGALTNGVELSEPWRLVAACFLHMGALHLAMNMLALIELGRVGEPLVKGPRYFLTFFVTGVLGFVFSAWWYRTTPYITAGASGAIFGLDGMFLGHFISRGDQRWKDMLVRTVVQSFVFYFVMRTNQAAHMGGLVSGIGIGLLFARESRPWRRDLIVHVACALAAALVVACLVYPHLR